MDAGIRQSFAVEVERLADRLFGAAPRLTRNRGDAEELVAETVAKAWATCPELRGPRSFAAWIQRILANTFVSAWRHRRASPEIALEPDEAPDEESRPFSLFEKLHQPFLLWWSSPEQSVMAKRPGQDIERALDGLPDAFRIAVVLVDVQGHSYQEAAEPPPSPGQARIPRAPAEVVAAWQW